MKVTVLVLNDQAEPHFKADDHLNIEALLQIALGKQSIARAQGMDFTRDALPVFARDVVEAANTGEHKDVTSAITNLVLVAWLFDSVYCGVTEDQYRTSDLQFVIAHDGAVAKTLIPRDK